MASEEDKSSQKKVTWILSACREETKWMKPSLPCMQIQIFNHRSTPTFVKYSSGGSRPHARLPSASIHTSLRRSWETRKQKEAKWIALAASFFRHLLSFYLLILISSLIHLAELVLKQVMRGWLPASRHCFNHKCGLKWNFGGKFNCIR